MEDRDRIESLRTMIEALSRLPAGSSAASQSRTGPLARDPLDPIAEVAEVRLDSLGPVIETEYPLDHVHGAIAIGATSSIPPELVQVIARDSRTWRGLSSTAFLDIETTGLAGGAGTLAFLVGVGRFSGSSFSVTQFFLSDPGTERIMLERLASSLEGVTSLVTFNGKAFDVPLLETRYAMNRMEFPLDEPVHVDLLFPSRRIWSPVLQSCSLSSLEVGVLGHKREGDIPGWLIPSVYAGYLRTRNLGQIEPVMTHNRLDILSLTTLMARLVTCFEAPTGRHPTRDGVEALGAGLHYESLGFKREASCLYEESLALGLPDHLLPRARWAALRLSKGGRRWDQCLRQAHELALSGEDFRPWIEIAKHHEHRSGDYAAALSAARIALNLLSRDAALSPSARSRHEREISHRIRRLEDRIDRYRSNGR